MSPDSTTLKRCSKCGEWKSPDLFSKDRSRKDGLNVHCKACNAIYRAQNADSIREFKRRWEAENRERLREHKRNYDEANREKVRDRQRRYRADNLETIREQKRQYRAERREKERANRRRWREQNPDKVRAANRRWRTENPEMCCAHQNRRKALKLGNGGTYTVSELASIRAAQTDKKGRLICWKCGEPIIGTPHLDHWIPLDKSGLNSAGNLHYMHARCNMSKGAKHPSEIGRLL